MFARRVFSDNDFLTYLIGVVLMLKVLVCVVEVNKLLLTHSDLFPIRLERDIN